MKKYLKLFLHLNKILHIMEINLILQIVYKNSVKNEEEDNMREIQET